MYRFLGNKIAAVYSGYIGNFPDITAFFCAIFLFAISVKKLYLLIHTTIYK